ncbi:MAG: hypothetical protein M3450_20685 [Actinomycetota bacterium]|nr:hypothetical protein [Actinomycetota bacterium]
MAPAKPVDEVRTNQVPSRGRHTAMSALASPSKSSLAASWLPAAYRGAVAAVLPAPAGAGRANCRRRSRFDSSYGAGPLRRTPARKTWPPFFEWQRSGASFEIVSLDVTAATELADGIVSSAPGPMRVVRATVGVIGCESVGDHDLVDLRIGAGAPAGGEVLSSSAT